MADPTRPARMSAVMIGPISRTSEAETIARLSDDPMHAVFEVNVGSQEVVVAIAPSTSARFIAGSVYWNPLLASQDILVPRLLYSYLPESAGAFAYTVSERLSGRSVEDCYDGLGDAQRGALAHEVATAQREVGRHHRAGPDSATARNRMAVPLQTGE